MSKKEKARLCWECGKLIPEKYANRFSWLVYGHERHMHKLCANTVLKRIKVEGAISSRPTGLRWEDDEGS